MDVQRATELAYKNGFADGIKFAAEMKHSVAEMKQLESLSVADCGDCKHNCDGYCRVHGAGLPRQMMCKSFVPNFEITPEAAEYDSTH